ncbi:magnesium transporter, partial [Nocardia cyriacigeorgica]|uniref:magnesium transporter n=1 Tax=Nocardia cyriacigeorgica TaxID=135487 RepID=UPI00245741ED
FIPLLIGAGGNAGAQAATACVRALAVGEVRGSDLRKVIWRECRVGLGAGGGRATAVANAVVAEVEHEWSRHLGPRATAQLRRALTRLRDITDPYR